MFNFFKKRRENREAAVAERKKRIEAARSEAEKSIDSVTEEMLKKPCPVNNREMCFEGCVHFKRGHVFYMGSFLGDSDGFWIRRFPKCKLWGEN